VTDKPIHFLGDTETRIGTFRRQICVTSMVFGADGLGSMRSKRARFFPEDQIQLIGIEARVFTNLLISKPNGDVG
jgi:hypothetical protein